MADLIDRISGASERMDPPRPKINLHALMGVERLYALGEWTRTQVDAEFDFQGDEQRQATQIANAIDGAGNVTNRIVYILRVESVLMCVEDHGERLYHNTDSTVNKPKVFEDLQITG